MINSDMNMGGIFKGFIIGTDDNDIRVYVPGLNSLLSDDKSIINNDNTLNREVYETNKNILPKPIWCLPNLEAKQHDEVHPCWIAFENGNAKRPIIMGYLGKGIKYHAGGSSLNPFGTYMGFGKKVLIVPGHSVNEEVVNENGSSQKFNVGTEYETNFGNFSYTGDARDENGEVKYTRKTAQYMHDYIENNSSGLSELYSNMNDISKSLFKDVFNKTIQKGFFNNYQAIVEIHFNSGGNGMFLKDDQIEDTNVISIGEEMCDSLKEAGYPIDSKNKSTSLYKPNKCLVNQRCSVIDGNQAYYYIETKNMDKGVSDDDCKKIGEALGKVICSHYRVIQGGGLATLAAQWAVTLVSKPVTYSQSNRMANFESDNPTSLDCSSFVHWCYYKAGVLPVNPGWTTESFYESAKNNSGVFTVVCHVQNPSYEQQNKIINQLQSGDILLRGSSSNFACSTSNSHALIVASGAYEENNKKNNFTIVDCSTNTSNRYGCKNVRGTNTFFFSNSTYYYAVLRLKGSGTSSSDAKQRIENINNDFNNQ